MVISMEVLPIETNFLCNNERATQMLSIIISNQRLEEEGIRISGNFNTIIKSATHEGIFDSQIIPTDSFSNISFVNQFPSL